REDARALGGDLRGAAACLESTFIVLPQTQDDAKRHLRFGGCRGGRHGASRLREGRRQAVVRGESQGADRGGGGIVRRQLDSLARILEGGAQPCRRFVLSERVQVDRDTRQADVRVGAVRTGLERLAEQAGRPVLILGTRAGGGFETPPPQGARPAAGRVAR